MYNIYAEDGYLLDESGDVVTLNTYENYFKKFVKVYAGTNTAEFHKVELDLRMDCFVLEYAIPAEDCANCDTLGIVEGVCDGHGEGHRDPHQEFIYYKRVEIYAV